MKKIAILLICSVSLMTAACGGAEKPEASEPETAEASAETTAEPEEPENQKEDQTGEVLEKEESGTEVSQGGPYGEISITLPEGWVWAGRDALRRDYAVPNAFRAFVERVARRLGYFA